MFCVTGGSGFVASQLIKSLLAKGHTVRATVRDTSNALKTAHLTALPGASERLSLYEAKDLLDEGVFDDAVKECVGVFHTASPFFFSTPTDAEAQLLKPAVQGTLNVLRSVDKAGHRPRVVVTSSVAAVAATPSKGDDYVYTEEDWSDEAYMRRPGKEVWYHLSKTLAERAAWDFVDTLPATRQFPLVTVNPVLVTGEMLQPSLNTSSELVLRYIDGTMKDVDLEEDAYWTYVDNEDVADLHVAVMEDSETTGRFLATGDTFPSNVEVADALRRLYPQFSANIPSGVIPSRGRPVRRMSNAKARTVLKRDFLSLDDSLRRTVDSLIFHGFLDAKPSSKL